MPFVFHQTMSSLQLQGEKVKRCEHTIKKSTRLIKKYWALAVLKILTVNRAEVREVLNLRAGSHVNINYSCNDVKWGNNSKWDIYCF